MKTIKSVNVESRNFRLSKLNSRCMSLQKLIRFIVYTSNCIICISANMVCWAERASIVIMNQEEKNVNRNTCEDNDNVNHVTLVTALGGAWLFKFTMLGKAGITDPLQTCTVVVRLDIDMTKVSAA